MTAKAAVGEQQQGAVVAREFIEAALADADINALRIALLQATGARELAELEIVLKPIRGGAFFLHSLTAEGEAQVKAKALEFLSDPGNRGPRTDVPSDAMIRELAETLTGQTLSPTMLPLAREELAFKPFPRDSQWTVRPADSELAQFHVLIVGGGASGIAAGIKFGRLGIPYTIIERLDDITGTWHRNQYPDVRVDTNCFLYQFKFEKRYPWAEYFPTQGRVKEYLRMVADKYGVGDHVRLSEEVVSAVWNAEGARWIVTTRSAGNVHQTYEANVIISATGVFGTPLIPDLPGLDEFRGTVVHTANWDPTLELEGRRVVLIGNGSTGTQILPRLAAAAAQVTAFQRTPQWIVNSPLLREKLSDASRWLLDAMPYYWNWASYVQFIGTAETQLAQVVDKEWQRAGGLINERNDQLRASLISYVDSKVGHRPDLRAKSIPDYAPLARRIVVDNGWFDALLRDNVTLETGGLAHVDADGVGTADGRHLPADIIVLATGFEVSKYFHPIEYVGRDGATFASEWSRDGARAYLGMTMPKFPNFYSLYGPNATPRFGGFLQWVDVWTRYVADLIIHQIEGGFAAVECKPEIFDDYNRRMDEATAGLLWESEGKGGYFVNEFGRSGLQMPWEADLYHSWVENPCLTDFNWS